jgi:hypothetical protein
MKKSLQNSIITLVFVTGLQTFAQSPSWQWARSAGSTGNEAVTSTVLDASGNLYAIGWYTSATITFGSTTLVNAGSFTGDIFVVKYDASGNALWAKSFGGVDGEIGNGMAVDASGDVYVTGLFTSTVMTMGTFTLTNTTAGSSDIFIARINSAGNTVWAKSAGGTASEKGMAITVDASGNVFTTGGFNSATINFGTGILTNASSGTSDFFIAKHDQNGNALWAKSAGGSASDQGNGIATDASGDVYLTGMYSSTSINFGTGALTNAAPATQDLYIVKYDAAGTAVWSLRSGGSFDDFGNGIAVQGSNVYLTGGFNSSSVAFGTTTLTNASAGTSDVLLANLDLGGNATWATRAGDTDGEAGNGIAVNATGDIFISGYFSGTTIIFGTTTLTNAAFGYRDLFVAAYNAGGNAVWAATPTGGTYDETGNSVSVSGTDIYLGGTFNSSSVTFGTNTVFKGCGDDVLVAKILGPLVGIKEEHFSKQLMLYPNPTSAKFIIEAEGQILFYNVLGENILSEKLSQKNEFDFSSFPKGIYLYKVLTEEKDVYTGRVVLE